MLRAEKYIVLVESEAKIIKKKSYFLFTIIHIIQCSCWRKKLINKFHSMGFISIDIHFAQKMIFQFSIIALFTRTNEGWIDYLFIYFFLIFWHRKIWIDSLERDFDLVNLERFKCIQDKRRFFWAFIYTFTILMRAVVCDFFFFLFLYLDFSLYFIYVYTYLYSS